MIPIGGVVEVNHPGGSCWEGVTPEVRANDVVRATLYRRRDRGSRLRAPDPRRERLRRQGGADRRPTPSSGPRLRPGPRRQAAAPRRDRGAPGRQHQEPVRQERPPHAARPEDGSLSYDTIDNPLGTRWTATLHRSRRHRRRARARGRVAGHVARPRPARWARADHLRGRLGGDPPGPAAGFCSSPLESARHGGPVAPRSLTAPPTARPAPRRSTWSRGRGRARTSTATGSAVTARRSRTSAARRRASPTRLSRPGAHVYTVQAHDSASGLGEGTGSAEDRLTAGQGLQYGNLSARPPPAARTAPTSQPPTVPANLQGTNPRPTRRRRPR